MAKGYIVGTSGDSFVEAGDLKSPVYIDESCRLATCVPYKDAHVKGSQYLVDDSSKDVPVGLNIGSPENPIYFKDGLPVKTTTVGKSSGAEKLVGTDSASTPLAVGGPENPVYFKDGVPYAANSYESMDTPVKKSNNVLKNSTDVKMWVAGFQNQTSGDYAQVYFNENVYTKGSVIYNAAWNDYAEYRVCENVEPGTCVIENGSKMVKSSGRLQKAPSIVSDTFGMVIGNEKGSKPIAVAGRVLAKVYEDELFEVGDAVCSGKDGTVTRMSRLEIILFPDRIVGYVSEIPTKKTWNKIKINNRIWIKLK